MSPRAYELGKRTAGVAKTRATILQATRQLLASSTSFAEVSVPAIARLADVSRDTVYRQFGSRSGLLEAVFDDSAERGGLGRLVDAVTAPQALDGLGQVVTVFCGYWSKDFAIHRALRALAGLDPDLSGSLLQRDGRRRTVLAILCGRLADEDPTVDRVGVAQRDRTVDLLQLLTGFEAYAQLRSSREPDEVSDMLHHVVQDVLAVSRG